MTLAHSVGPEIDGVVPPTDAELIRAVQAGDRQAYGMLYERHLAAARAHARQLTRSYADADDLVAEAFAKVLSALRAGRGPESAFRAYLLTTLRNCFYQRMRRDRRLELSDDMAAHDQGVPWSDPVEAELNSSLAARAFSALPERWQTVLWRREVERRSLAEIGEGLGLRPNAVAALAYRAREGLRQAYLQAHLAGNPDEGCWPAVQRLGVWTRGKLAPAEAALVGEHLAGCDRCERLAAELADENGGIRGLLAPLAVAGTVAGYPSSGAGVASVGVVASGTAVGAAGLPPAATGTGTALGSALGWALGTHGGQVAAAVLTAVVISGTAVTTGAGVPGPGGREPTTAAVAVPSADETGSTSTRIHPTKLIPQRTSAPEKGKPPSGKPSDGKSSKSSKGKSSKGEQLDGKPPQGKPSEAEASKKPSKSDASSSQATSSSTASSSKHAAAAEVEGRSAAAKASLAESWRASSAQEGPSGVDGPENPTAAIGATSRSAKT